MAIATIEQLKEQIGWSADLGTADDGLMARKLDAAQGHIERLLGFKIAERYGDDGQEPVPQPLAEGVLQLAAHWYENREASVIGVSAIEIPFGVWSIVNEYREWTFG